MSKHRKGSGKGSGSASSSNAWDGHGYNSSTAQNTKWGNDNQKWGNDDHWGTDKQWGKDDHWDNADDWGRPGHKMPKGAYGKADEDFGGAYPGVSLDIDKACTTCYLCNANYTFGGCVALMKAPDYDTFFRFEDKIVTQVAQAIQTDGIENIPFRNMGKDADGKPINVAQVCYKCAGEKQKDDKNYYVSKRPDGSCGLSMYWHHKQQNNKAPLLALQEKMERKGDAERLPSDKAIDWVNKVGPETYIPTAGTSLMQSNQRRSPGNSGSQSSTDNNAGPRRVVDEDGRPFSSYHIPDAEWQALLDAHRVKVLVLHARFQARIDASRQLPPPNMDATNTDHGGHPSSSLASHVPSDINPPPQTVPPPHALADHVPKVTTHRSPRSVGSQLVSSNSTSDSSSESSSGFNTPSIPPDVWQRMSCAAVLSHQARSRGSLVAATPPADIGPQAHHNPVLAGTLTTIRYW